MEPEYDFSKGERGKFYSPGARLHIPIYLDSELQERLESIARSRGTEVDQLVDELLRHDLQRLEKSGG